MNTDFAGEVNFTFDQSESPKSEPFEKWLIAVISFVLSVSICVHLWFH